jgi:hypothetical protein
MSNFISKVFLSDILAAKEELKDSARVRLQNISWPSEASADVGPFRVGECKRALFYKVIGVQASEEFSIRGRAICDAGLLYEKYHIEKFKAKNLYYEDQYRIEYETNTVNKVIISGKVDLIINDDGVLKAIEIKSVSAFKAPEMFGSTGKLPLPAANNLMQAMLYKYWTKHTELGQRSGIKEVYLMYVNRSDGSVFYYEVDLDEAGFPIIRAVDQVGKEIYKMHLASQKSYEQILAESREATSEEGSIAELRININDIFAKFDDVYTYAKDKMLPAPDYKMIYSAEDLQRELHCGRLTKRKITSLKKSGESYGDYRCSFCSFKKKCLGDSGITFL